MTWRFPQPHCRFEIGLKQPPRACEDLHHRAVHGQRAGRPSTSWRLECNLPAPLTVRCKAHAPAHAHDRARAPAQRVVQGARDAHLWQAPGGPVLGPRDQALSAPHGHSRRGEDRLLRRWSVPHGSPGAYRGRGLVHEPWPGQLRRLPLQSFLVVHLMPALLHRQRGPVAGTAHAAPLVLQRTEGQSPTTATCTCSTDC